MAYDGAGLSLVSRQIGLSDGIWLYRSTDTFIGTVDGTGYFTDGYTRGMRTGMLVVYHKTDGTQPSLGYVSASSSTTFASTVTALGTGASAGAGTFTTLASSGTTTLGDAAADTIGFYGATAVSQRASSVQATSNYASSTDFGAAQLAWQVEVGNTLKGLGAWKGSA